MGNKAKKDLERFNFHLKELKKLSKRLGIPIINPIFSALKYYVFTPGGEDNLIELATICTGYAKFTITSEKKKAVKGIQNHTR